MTDSDYDSANEYTSLMDGHVAEIRNDGINNDRRKRNKINKNNGERSTASETSSQV